MAIVSGCCSTPRPAVQHLCCMCLCLTSHPLPPAHDPSHRATCRCKASHRERTCRYSRGSGLQRVEAAQHVGPLPWGFCSHCASGSQAVQVGYQVLQRQQDGQTPCCREHAGPHGGDHHPAAASGAVDDGVTWQVVWHASEHRRGRGWKVLPSCFVQWGLVAWAVQLPGLVVAAGGK